MDPNVKKESVFRSGAVAMIDGLGVKGAWRGPGGKPDLRVLDTMREARRVTENLSKRYVGEALGRVFVELLGVEPTVDVVAISDTIILTGYATPIEGVNATGTEEQIAFGVLDAVCLCVGYAMRYAAKMDRPMVYRGAVSYGDFLMDGHSVLGPAVDEAGECMELADGGFVWLTPSAAKLSPSSFGPVWRTYAHNYRVPLKGGQAIDTVAMSPFIDVGTLSEERGLIRAGYEKAMQSPKIDVTVKRQNTMRFLDHVAAADAKREGEEIVREEADRKWRAEKEKSE